MDMMDNMRYYNAGREVPDAAKKTIKGGKLSGFTDINPMWRIQKLTELFGVCGVGWYTEIKRIWAEEGKDGRVAAFCEIHLYVKVDGEWSRPIEGIGGSMLVNVFKGSPETSDECYKMAYTDAISVAAKALGIGADVYWAAGRTKYSHDEKKEPVYCTRCKQKLKDEIKTSKRTFTAQEYFDKFGGLCPDCATADYAARKNKGEGE